MNIFKTFTLKWWEAAIFKLSLLSLGILLGSTWPDIFAPWRGVLLVIFALSTLFLCRGAWEMVKTWLAWGSMSLHRTQWGGMRAYEAEWRGVFLVEKPGDEGRTGNCRNFPRSPSVKKCQKNQLECAVREHNWRQ